MNLHFFIFISVLFVALGLSSFYLSRRFISGSDWGKKHRKIIYLSLVLFLLLQILGPVLYRIYPEDAQRFFIVQWIAYTSLGVFACMLFYTMLTEVLLLISRPKIPKSRQVDFERRSFIGVSFITLVSSVIGSIQALSGPRVDEVEIPIDDLPEAFEGFTIAQISDLHLGPLISESYCQNVVNITNGLKPDLIALTGDLVDGTVEMLRQAAAPLGTLKAEHGVFFVTGNHEYYWDALDWCEEFKRLGAKVLLNEHVLLQKAGQQMVLAGVTDLHAHRMMPAHQSDPLKALQGAPQEGVKLLLAHQPGSYDQASKAGFHLQLSGHTHAGQFFPWNMLVAMVHRYYKGLNRHENMWVYVNRGTGYWGPPMRFGVPAEITLIKLKKKTRVV